MGNSNSQFGQTKTSVYQISRIKESTENTTENFKVRDGYYKNKKNIFYKGINLNLNASQRKTFKKLKYSYAKTNNLVFYKGEIIPEANPQTFIVINRKNMPEEFENLNSVIGMDFEKNLKRVYQFGKLIYNIKVNQFIISK